MLTREAVSVIRAPSLISRIRPMGADASHQAPQVAANLFAAWESHNENESNPSATVSLVSKEAPNGDRNVSAFRRAIWLR